MTVMIFKQFTLFALLTILVTACGAPETTKQPPAAIDMEAEEAAIKAVIAAETQAFVATDIDKMLTYHTDPMTMIATDYTSDFIYSYIFSHRQAKPLYQGYLSDEPNLVDADFKRSDWNIHISEDATMAWITYKGATTVNTNELRSEETRTMEKENGVWKMALTGTLVHKHRTDLPN